MLVAREAILDDIPQITSIQTIILPVPLRRSGQSSIRWIRRHCLIHITMSTVEAFLLSQKTGIAT